MGSFYVERESAQTLDRIHKEEASMPAAYLTYRI